MSTLYRASDDSGSRKLALSTRFENSTLVCLSAPPRAAGCQTSRHAGNHNGCGRVKSLCENLAEMPEKMKKTVTGNRNDPQPSGDSRSKSISIPLRASGAPRSSCARALEKTKFWDVRNRMGREHDSPLPWKFILIVGNPGKSLQIVK